MGLEVKVILVLSGGIIMIWEWQKQEQEMTSVPVWASASAAVLPRRLDRRRKHGPEQGCQWEGSAIEKTEA